MGGIEVFTFGDPEPVLSNRWLDYRESAWSGKWYEPPVNLSGLHKLIGSSVYHASALHLKRNLLASSFKPSSKLSRTDFARFAMDYLWSGNGYLEPIRNGLGEVVSYRAALSLYTRRGKAGFWWVPTFKDEREFDALHLQQPDTQQEIYGIPEYLAGIQSALLNESATLFRRKYYENGSHAGFILYISDAVHDEADIDALRGALRSSKGPGNFRNLFLYAPNGKKDGIQVIPISEVTAKDEFINIKNVTRDDLLSIHRVPPQLMAVIPTGGAAFGDASTAIKVFALNEIGPLQQAISAINEIAGETIVSFSAYGLPSQSAA